MLMQSECLRGMHRSKYTARGTNVLARRGKQTTYTLRTNKVCIVQPLRPRSEDRKYVSTASAHQKNIEVLYRTLIGIEHVTDTSSGRQIQPRPRQTPQ